MGQGSLKTRAGLEPEEAILKKGRKLLFDGVGVLDKESQCATIVGLPYLLFKLTLENTGEENICQLVSLFYKQHVGTICRSWLFQRSKLGAHNCL